MSSFFINAPYVPRDNHGTVGIFSIGRSPILRGENLFWNFLFKFLFGDSSICFLPRSSFHEAIIVQGSSSPYMFPSCTLSFPCIMFFGCTLASDWELSSTDFVTGFHTFFARCIGTLFGAAQSWPIFKQV